MINNNTSNSNNNNNNNNSNNIKQNKKPKGATNTTNKMSEVGILGCKHPSLEKYIESCKKKALYRGKLPKKGGFRQFADLRGGWGKKGDGVFDGGGVGG